MLKIKGISPIDTLYSYWARRYLQISDDSPIPNRQCKWSILIKVRPILFGLDCFYPISKIRSWPKTPVSDRFIDRISTYSSYLLDSHVGPYRYWMSHIYLQISLTATPYLFLRYHTAANYPFPGYLVLVLVATPSACKNSRWQPISKVPQNTPAGSI